MLFRTEGIECVLALCAGDSRAVLCRGSIAIPLTDDHKAAREDETVRARLHALSRLNHVTYAVPALPCYAPQ